MDWGQWLLAACLIFGISVYIGLIVFVELRRRQWRRQIDEADASLRAYRERALREISEKLALIAVTEQLGPGEYRIVIRDEDARATRH